MKGQLQIQGRSISSERTGVKPFNAVLYKLSVATDFPFPLTAFEADDEQEPI